MTHKQHYNFYIASYDENGGIYHYRLLSDGTAEYVNHTPMDRPMYMVISDNKMYVLLRAPFDNSNESGLITYDINNDGDLINPSDLVSTRGEVACNLCISDRQCYCANYTSGSIIKMPSRLVEHRGKSINPTRQTSPHPHFVGITNDKEYICATDLGLDSIFLYDKDLNLVSKSDVPRGHGPRHLAFSQNNIYCANELKSTLSVFTKNHEVLEYITTIPVLPSDFSGESTVAAIRIKNNFCYISNRGHDSLSIIDISEEHPKLLSTVSCGGKSPRDFNIIDDMLICANENSDNVSFFKLVNGEPHKMDTEITLKSPLCVAF